MGRFLCNYFITLRPTQTPKVRPTPTDLPTSPTLNYLIAAHGKNSERQLEWFVWELRGRTRSAAPEGGQGVGLPQNLNVGGTESLISLPNI